MAPSLQNIIDLLAKLPQISEAERTAIQKFVSDADKQLAIVEFKLDRTEKVKRTTAILLEETIEELEQKRRAIEDSNSVLTKLLEDLKAAQAQLIQAEKMASLGELIAGIAHEIQNPLNFVNNFSEVSKELIDEMNDELAVGNNENAKELASDIEQNLIKIIHHGKRADSIVKSMLQHSRKSSGQKELTDINKLAEEYFRLAYHGLRSKNKEFNALLHTELDERMPHLQVVSQDIGRVLLNLINNAFYACMERQKMSRNAGHEKSITESGAYAPTVILKTITKGNHAEISVRDNGSGIPEHIKEKIFQPFFTTKPTGEGTGLGLSLSYDIIKAHGGELKVESQHASVSEDAGTEFIITLPIT
jgi:two-component system, NtrC family, sensor kinase